MKKINKYLIKFFGSNIFSIFLDLFLICLISIVFYFSYPIYSSKVIYIPKGSTKSIITYLNKSGIDVNSFDYYIIKFLGYPQSGWIDLKSNYSTKIDFLKKLTTSKAAVVNITLIPGETNYFFLQQVAKKLRLNYKKLFIYYNEYAYKIEGAILADTYSFPLGISEKHIMYSLIKQSDEKFEAMSKKIFGNYDRKFWYKYIIIASIIQKEAASKEEMPIISSVIYNRLKRGLKLQMDGTLNYGKYSHTKVTPKRIKEDTSIYNTYKIKGLPSQPICAVSLEAIKAAIFPAKTDYLYFTLDKSGKKHLFSNTYKEHKRKIRK